MKDTLGLLLRERWREKGNPECQHPELSPERSFSGTVTGDSICTTCGALIKNPAYSQKEGRANLFTRVS